jgi:hypothetical protein
VDKAIKLVITKGKLEDEFSIKCYVTYRTALGRRVTKYYNI